MRWEIHNDYGADSGKISGLPEILSDMERAGNGNSVP
jgi:hypothetical protein